MELTTVDPLELELPTDVELETDHPLELELPPNVELVRVDPLELELEPQPNDGPLNVELPGLPLPELPLELDSASSG